MRQERIGNLIKEELTIRIDSYEDFIESSNTYHKLTQDELMYMHKYDYYAIKELVGLEWKKLEYDYDRCCTIKLYFEAGTKSKALKEIINTSCIKVSRGLCSFQAHHYYRYNDIYKNAYKKINKVIFIHKALDTARMLSPILNPNSILMKSLGEDIVVDILATHFGHELVRNKYIIKDDFVVLNPDNIFQTIIRTNNVIKLLNDLIVIKKN